MTSVEDFAKSGTTGIAGPSRFTTTRPRRADSTGQNTSTSGSSAISPEAFSPLQRQISFTDPAALVAGFPELERGLSATSNKSRRSRRDRDVVDAGKDTTGVARAGRRASDITEAEEGGDEKDRAAVGGEEEKGEDGETGGRRSSSSGPAASDGGAEITFPDGGSRAWLVVLGGFVTVFSGFGLTGSIGAFQTLYRSTFLASYSDSQIAWIVSVQSFLTFGLSCFTGAFFDKYGHRPLIAAGTICLTLGFCMLSLCSEYYQLMLVHATLLPAGCNLLFMCPIAVVGQWFQRRRGLAFGLMSTGSSLGSVIWPLLLANLPQRVGFGWTCRLIALLCLILGIIAFFLLKTRLPPKPAGSFFYFEAFRSMQYNLVVLNFICFGFAFFAFLTFIGTYGQLAGLGSLAPYLLIIQNGCSMIGRLGSGILADKIGTYNANLIGNFLFVLMYFVWLGVKHTTAGLIVVVVIMGIAGGSFVCLQPALAVMTARDMRYGGTMMGQALFVMAFAQLACGPSFGALLGTGTPQERFDSFWRGIILCACLSLVGAVFILVARWDRNKKIWAKA